MEKFNWVFIPVLNPDGYVYTWKNNKTRMWRKNRSHTPSQLSLFNKTGNQLCIGTDINRNFDLKWGGKLIRKEILRPILAKKNRNIINMGSTSKLIIAKFCIKNGRTSQKIIIYFFNPNFIFSLHCHRRIFLFLLTESKFRQIFFFVCVQFVFYD